VPPSDTASRTSFNDLVVQTGDAVADGEEWRDAMTASLARLDLLATP